MVSMDNFDNKSKGSDYFSTAQLNWLEGDLARNQNQWKFVYFHIPMYSDGDFASSKELCEQLEPIFYKYEVDVVFYGHDHHFESFLVNGTSAYGGIYHFVVGGGGGGIDPMGNTEKYGARAWPTPSMRVSESDGRYAVNYGSQYQLYAELTHHYMKVEVNGESATFSAIDYENGTPIVKYQVNRTNS
jgi:Calcineurin-like phosphoesterase